RGAVPRRPHGDHDRPARPHQTDHRRRVPASAQPDGALRDAGLRRAQARHLARAGARGHACASGGRTMNRSRERLLYLISPIGLLAIWQALLMLGIGDRRFIPTPSDIAVRFWQVTVSGELAVHVGVTLWRAFAGFLLGSIPAIACGLLM